ncbi:MAG: nuclear transport factor 2 family protein, partial [Acidimicrobiales bacterium]
FRGRAAIVAGLPATQPAEPGRIKHIVFPPVIDLDEGRAKAWSDVIVSLVPPAGPAELSFVGRYHDRLRMEDGRWRLESHVTVKTGDSIPDDDDPPPAA